jgi:hypothetical protein
VVAITLPNTFTTIEGDTWARVATNVYGGCDIYTTTVAFANNVGYVAQKTYLAAMSITLPEGIAFKVPVGRVAWHTHNSYNVEEVNDTKFFATYTEMIGDTNPQSYTSLEGDNVFFDWTNTTRNASMTYWLESYNPTNQYTRILAWTGGGAIDTNRDISAATSLRPFISVALAQSNSTRFALKDSNGSLFRFPSPVKPTKLTFATAITNVSQIFYATNPDTQGPGPSLAGVTISTDDITYVPLTSTTNQAIASTTTVYLKGDMAANNTEGTAYPHVDGIKMLFRGKSNLIRCENIHGISPGPMKPHGWYQLFRGVGTAANHFVPTPDLLPDTTLAIGCYSQMFLESHLDTWPTLPATTLAEECYKAMFGASGCYCYSTDTQLILPATILAANCYREMFYQSYQLFKNGSGIEVHFTNWTVPVNNATTSWFGGSSTGLATANVKFRCPEALDTTTKGDNRVPTGTMWVVEKF